VQVFHELKSEFDFVFLPGVSSSEPDYSMDIPSRYWSEFEDASILLDDINPNAIVFMSIDSGLSMVLNHVAQKRGLTTFILQHGIYTNYRDYRIREKLWQKSHRATKIQSSIHAIGFSSKTFAFNSLKGVAKLNIIAIALFSQFQKRVGPYWASKHLPLKIKKASKYLCFSPYNAIIHKELDRVSENDLAYVGSSELMQYLKKEEPLDDDYYLHIDQALAENSLGEETVSREEMVEFYLKLNTYCLTNKAKLYIKLHPESYSSDWLPKDENIIYIRNTNKLNAYIQSAKGCFGFYSTMVIPAAYWGNLVLFNIFYSGLQEALDKYPNVTTLDFRGFDSKEIVFTKESGPLVNIKEEFIQPIGVSLASLKERFS